LLLKQLAPGRVSSSIKSLTCNGSEAVPRRGFAFSECSAAFTFVLLILVIKVSAADMHGTS
jgi:hypothetical protein